MSVRKQQCKSNKILAAKNDKNMKRYSENEKTLLYELFERYQEIIDIKLRRNLYSSTKQCEVRECWELILKTFNEDVRTSERTMKQLQKFWLNAKLRRMIPTNKYQSESNSRRTSSDSKLLRKPQPTATIERVSVENHSSNYVHHSEEVQSKPDAEREEKPQIFNIKYVVPSSLIIREHQPQHHTITDEETPNLQDSSKDISLTTNNDPQDHDSEPEPDPDHDMQEEPDDVLHENDNSFSHSNQEKIENLRLQEMENRVCESQLRCEVQKLIISKAEEEFKHLQEMNKLRLEEAKIRLKLLERNLANDRGNLD